MPKPRNVSGSAAASAVENTDSGFSGEIVVASRIVDYLSSGLYESPAACLKELINNSYDADARRVTVFVKPDADRIIIEDDGVGMNRADFEKHFTKISESYKREDGDTTAMGRPKIGKIGIGFIAANEICDVMELFSTKKGSKELLHVSINFDVMRQSVDSRRRGDKEIAKADYEGTIENAPIDDHYTILFLKRVRGEARTILAGAASRGHTAGSKSLYGLNEEQIGAILAKPEVDSWSEFDSYSQNMLQVALNVPVQYMPDWIPHELKEPVRPFVQRTDSLQFKVTLDGTNLRKPIIFSPPSSAFVEQFKFRGHHVSADGYFYIQHKGIRPRELQGLLIRIRNAAIGDYDQSFLDFSSSEGPLFQSWVSAEIWADDRLEDAMNIDRKTLRIAHPAYVELQGAIHACLSELIKRARSELYGAGSRERDAKRAEGLVVSLGEVAKAASTTIGRPAAAALVRKWQAAGESPVLQRRLLKKYSVVDLYRVVLEVAEDVMSPAQVREFVKRLTERLSK